MPSKRRALATPFAVACIPFLAIAAVANACGPREPVQAKGGPVGAPVAEGDPSQPTFVESEAMTSRKLDVGFTAAGIYVLPGDPDSLVLFRTDGDYAPLSLLRPLHIEKNQWQFETPGERLETSDPRLTRVINLPHEGFYRLTRELVFKDGGRWLQGAVVQLGYTKAGEPIVFIAQRREEPQNVLFFSDRGVKIHNNELQWLEPVAWYQEPAASGSTPSGT